jgi:hypothetical protein
MVDRGGTGRWRGDAWSQTMLTLIVEGYLLGLVVSLPVGPVTVNLMRRALNYGFWNATAFGGGSASADLVYISLVYFGVAPLLAEQAWQRIGLSVGGASGWAWHGGRTRCAAPSRPGGGQRLMVMSAGGATWPGRVTLLKSPDQRELAGPRCGVLLPHPLTTTLQVGWQALVAIGPD